MSAWGARAGHGTRLRRGNYSTLPADNYIEFDRPGQYLWTPPSGASFIDVIVIGGGAGGTSGACGAAGTARSGGGAGGAGGKTLHTVVLDKAYFSTIRGPWFVTVGPGGAGAPASSGASTQGVAGTGSSVALKFNDVRMTNWSLTAGGGNLGGILTTGGSGGGGTWTGQTGGSSAGAPSTKTDIACLAGGGGGSLTNLDVASAGGAGGSYSVASGVSVSALSGGAANNNGLDSFPLFVLGRSGIGPSGGGASAAGPGGKGGDGVRGAGGAGGGASVTGQLSGAGGNGGDGVVIFVVHY